MSMVRFATICDHCDNRSREYSAYPTCHECQAEVCPACMVPGTYDPEAGVCLCKRCSEDDLEKCSRCQHVHAAHGMISDVCPDGKGFFSDGPVQDSL